MSLTDQDYFEAAMAAVQQRNLGLAEKLFRASTELNPQHVLSLANLGTLLSKDGNLREAKQLLAQATALNPSSAHSWAMLGTVYTRQDQFRDARQCIARALELDPSNAAYHLNMAGQMEFASDLETAEKCYAQALACAPADQQVRYQWGIIKMTRGDFNAGLPLYECRLDHKSLGVWHPLDIVMRWGQSLDKVSKIVVVSEQGIGDLFQMARYGVVLRELFPEAYIVLRCDENLVNLLCRFRGWDCIIAHDHPLAQSSSFSVSAMSLPYLCTLMGKNMGQPPALIDVSRMQDPWLGSTYKKIGFSWKGNPQHGMDRFRSMPLQVIKKAFPGPDYYWACNLQFDAQNDPLVCESFQTGGASKDWVNTAAAIHALDVVVTVDTAVAHLAGTLGKRVFLLLSKVPDWRWGLEGDTTPWYPSMRLFRQKEFMNWEPVLEEVREALEREIA